MGWGPTARAAELETRMALIRQSDARTKARDAIVLDLGDLMHQGDQIKSAAKARAAQILAEAKAERERIVAGAAEEGRALGLARGHQEGVAKGQAEGRESALAELRARLNEVEKAWIAALDEFESRRVQMLREARGDVLSLAALVAERVTKRAVVLQEEAVKDQLAAVLALLARPTRLRVAVNPEDEPLLRSALPALIARFAGAEHVELAADPEVSRGSCIARAGSGGRIDASIEAQLDRIVGAMMPDGRRGTRGSGEAP